MESFVTLSVRWLLIGCLMLTCFGQTKTVGKPPIITEQADAEMSYKPGEPMEIKCVATGDPLPVYRWTKNGEPLNVNGLAIRQIVGRGTIVLMIDEPFSYHDGIYQCFASNDFGTAVSIKTVLKKAMLDPFPTIREPRAHRPAVGLSLSLRCTAPACYPQGNVYWGENRNGPKLQPVDTNERISLDYEGGLHFANIEMDDSRDGRSYVCVVSNLVLRNLVQGDDQVIRPHAVTETPKYEPPAIMWSTPVNDIAIAGQVKKLKCIFSGYPTPRVTWTRLDAAMGSKVTNASFGQELVISPAQFNDTGRYQCSAINTLSGTPNAVKDFALSVESPPFWRNDQPPLNVDASDEDDVTFECNVNGRPKPTIAWLINGQPLHVGRSDLRRTLSENGATLRFHNVSRNDTMVIQCNASNTHGYVYANAYLNVRAEAPSFLETPKSSLKVAQGQTAVLTCKVYGAPKPTIRWQKNMQQLVDVEDLGSSRLKVLPSGDLQIEDVVHSDEDIYQCYTFNKHGSDSSSGQLIVTNRTRIITLPLPQNVTSPDDVTLTCDAITDDREMATLRIEWLRKDETGASRPVEDIGDGRFEVSDAGRRLTIRRSRVNDTGHYTCRARSDIDHDSVSVIVSVRDRPDSPKDVSLSVCTPTSAEVTWSPGADNNDPIIAYVVYFATSHDDVTSAAGQRHEGARVAGSARSARVHPLSAWTGYTFSVAAVNTVGESLAATVHGNTACRTPPGPPQRHPRRVCTDSRGPKQLVIVWEPMLPIEQGSDGFYYDVSYRRRTDDTPSREWRRANVTEWRQSELIVSSGVSTYEEYEFSVKAVNSLGSAPNSTLQRWIGYSGEDVPVEVPVNFQCHADTINATSALCTWDPVDQSVDRIRGFFRGYQVQFWKTDKPSIVRSVDFIEREWKPCRPLDDLARSASGRNSRSTDVVRGQLMSLWPFASITAGVKVLNGARAGPLSSTVTFQTAEGVPDAVPMFWVSERGSHHLRVSWTAPFEINGILTGYIISYREASPTDDTTLRETMIADPQQTSKKLFNLRDDTVYLLTIWALTAAGRGVEKVINEVTVPSSEPDRPMVTGVDNGYDYLNVSWRPSTELPSINPAPEFVVEYQIEGSEDWERTAVESEHHWINISGLVHASSYRIRVVAIDRHGDSMKSDPIQVTVGIQPAAVVHRSTSASVPIAVICVLLIVLILALIAVTLYRRRHSGRYPVHEKEKLHGANGGNLYDEAPFGEYVRTDDSLKKKSMGSLESSSKSEEDPTDSLGIYEDVDPIKFTDDGSFVEHVGGYRKIDEQPDAEVTTTSALSSIV